MATSYRNRLQNSCEIEQQSTHKQNRFEETIQLN